MKKLKKTDHLFNSGHYFYRIRNGNAWDEVKYGKCYYFKAE